MDSTSPAKADGEFEGYSFALEEYCYSLHHQQGLISSLAPEYEQA